MRMEKPGQIISVINLNIFMSLFTVFILAFVIGGWAATTELSNAVITNGNLVVDGNAKIVQHPY